MVSTLPSSNPKKPRPVFHAPAITFEEVNNSTDFITEGTLDPPMVLHISSGIVEVVEGFIADYSK